MRAVDPSGLIHEVIMERQRFSVFPGGFAKRHIVSVLATHGQEKLEFFGSEFSMEHAASKLGKMTHKPLPEAVMRTA